MARRQLDKLLSPGIEERGCGNQQRPGALLDEGCERDVEIGFRIGAHDYELRTEVGRLLLHVAQLVFGVRIAWIDQHRDGRGLGNHLVQQAEPLGLEP
jgi:hypothetical protein